MDKKLAETIGRAARAARSRLGMTQVEVAALMDLSHIVYNRLERGKMLPSVPTLARLCDTLRVSPDELLGASRPSQAGRAANAKEDPPSLRHLTHLARKLDESERQVLLDMAKALLR
jgi:transcriptional regulator with XRE-family HTH domain